MYVEASGLKLVVALLVDGNRLVQETGLEAHLVERLIGHFGPDAIGTVNDDFLVLGQFEELDVSQSNLSQHLAKMRLIGLITTEKEGSYVYFNHGYYCAPKDENTSLATTDYGSPFASVVSSENIYGVQFHPEKSQDIGIQILKNFVEKI